MRVSKSAMKKIAFGVLTLIAVLAVLAISKKVFPQLLENFEGGADEPECSIKGEIKMCPKGKMCNPETQKCV